MFRLSSNMIKLETTSHKRLQSQLTSITNPNSTNIESTLPKRPRYSYAASVIIWLLDVSRNAKRPGFMELCRAVYTCYEFYLTTSDYGPYDRLNVTWILGENVMKLNPAIDLENVRWFKCRFCTVYSREKDVKVNMRTDKYVVYLLLFQKDHR